MFSVKSLTVGSLVATSILLGACSVTLGDKGVSAAQLETLVSAELAEQFGRSPELVECPEDLPEKAGSVVRCTLTDSGVSVGITVTSEGEDSSGKVQIDFKVDSETIE